MAKPFATAEGKRVEITRDQAIQIRNMYKDIEKDFKDRIRILSNKSNVSSTMRSQYLKDFSKDLSKEIELLNSQLEATITKNMMEVARAVANDNVKLLKDMGFAGMFNTATYNIPNNAVQRVISGKLYEGKWTLSKAIWSDNQKKLNDINTVIAKGLASNKSTYEIAKDLERYVNPNARKLWDWSKVYPGTSKKIDYNAQRLARTMISHAYQESFVESTKDNPFIDSYRWLASGGDRMCEICAERDDKIFPKDELPLDHPNGMCTFEPVISKSYDQIASELRAWVDNEGDPELDKQLDHYATTLGYNVKDWTANSEQVKNAEMQNNNIVNGTDISDTWQRRSDQFAFEIEDIINAQGFDGLPRIVSAEEFERYVQESNFIAQRTYSAPTQEILKEYQQQLYYGKWYVDCSTGGAAYGQGMYCAGNYEGKLTDKILKEMKDYQVQNLNYSGKESVHYVETITLDKSAKIVNYNDLEKMQLREGNKFWAIGKTIEQSGLTDEELAYVWADYRAEMSHSNDIFSYERLKTIDNIANELDKLSVDDWYKGYDKAIAKLDLSGVDEMVKRGKELKEMNIGSYAVAKGYDAIRTDHGTSGADTIILNRTKCIFKGE